MNILIAVFLISFSLTASDVIATEKNDALNRALSNSIIDDDIEKTLALLGQGADPNAQFLDSLSNSPMCAASDRGKLNHLIALMNSGGDVNNQMDGYASFFSAPLSCAIFFANYESFRYLLDGGAKADMELCTACVDPRFGTNMLQMALAGYEYRMMWDLIERGGQSDYAVADIVTDLETNYASKTLRANPFRRKIIRWLQKSGYQVSPKTDAERQLDLEERHVPKK